MQKLLIFEIIIKIQNKFLMCFIQKCDRIKKNLINENIKNLIFFVV